MAPRKISRTEIMIDIGAGLSNEEIGKKYKLSEKGTRGLLDKLLSVNLLTREDYDARIASLNQSIDSARDNDGRAAHNEVIDRRSQTPLTSDQLRGRSEDNDNSPHAGSTSDKECVEPAPQSKTNGHEIQEDFVPAPEEFFDVSKQGKNQWWRYLVGILFIMIFMNIAGGITAVVSGAHLDLRTGSFVGVDSLGNYILLNLYAVFLLVAVFLVVRIEHKRPFLSLITRNQFIDWTKIGTSCAVFGALLCVSGLVSYLLDPGDVQFSFNPGGFLMFAPAVLVLTPIQTTAEELFFRGYLLQMIALLIRNRSVLIFISGVLFTVPHLANPEVAAGLLPMSLYYFAVGGFLTLVTLKSNGLEMAIGVHAATNLFGTLILNYGKSALKTESIFFCSTLEPIASLLFFCFMAAVFYLLMFSKASPIARFVK